MNMPTIDRLVARFAGFLFGLAAIGMGQPAAAVPILSGETLEARFNLPSPPVSTIPGLPPGHFLGIADLLFGFLDVTRISGIGSPQATFALYDGADLLGSYSLSFAAPTTSFAFSAGAFTFRAGMISGSDFSSMRDGTIDGRLLITNTSVVDYDFSVRSLDIARGGGPNTIGNPFTPQPVITSQVLLAPTVVAEPPTTALLFAGVSALLILRRCSRGVASRANGHAMHVVAR